MVDSDDDEGSDISSYSHDVFETDNNIEVYEDLLLRDGVPSLQLPSKTTWKYHAFTDRGGKYIGELKRSVAKDDQPFNLRYNTIDRILFDKAKTEFKRSMTIIKANLNNRGGSLTVAPFTAFASVCPEEFFVLFKSWLKHGVPKNKSNTKDLQLCLGDICKFLICEINNNDVIRIEGCITQTQS